MTDVKCKVKTCYYWGDHDVCKANSILVENNTASGRRGVGMEVGELDIDAGNRSRNRKAGDRSFATPTEAGDLDTKVDAQGVQAHTSDETSCSTFRPKGSESRH